MRGVPIATAGHRVPREGTCHPVQGRRGRSPRSHSPCRAASPRRTTRTSSATPLTQPVRQELLVLRELPDRGEPVQRREHPRHELRHRVLGRPRLRRRLRRLPHLRRLRARCRRSCPTCAATARRAIRRSSTPTTTARRTRSSSPSTASSPARECGAGPAAKDAATGQYPEGAWEGLRVFDISDPAAPEQIAAVYQDCGSHTNTLLPAPGRRLDVRPELELPARRRPDVRPARRGRRAARSTTASCRSSRCRSTTRPRRAELTELPVVYPGDADGVYKPVSDHGIIARRWTTSSAATT